MVHVSHRHCSHSRVCVGVLEGMEMNTQPETLRLAEVMSLTFPGNKGIDMAAAELRRLHELNQELVEALDGILDVYDAMGNPRGPARIIADAALAKASGSATQTGETG